MRPDGCYLDEQLLNSGDSVGHVKLQSTFTTPVPYRTSTHAATVPSFRPSSNHTGSSINYVDSTEDSEKDHVPKKPRRNAFRSNIQFELTSPKFSNRISSASTASRSSIASSADWLDLASHSTEKVIDWISNQLELYKKNQLDLYKAIEKNNAITFKRLSRKTYQLAFVPRETKYNFFSSHMITLLTLFVFFYTCIAVVTYSSAFGLRSYFPSTMFNPIYNTFKPIYSNLEHFSVPLKKTQEISVLESFEHNAISPFHSKAFKHLTPIFSALLPNVIFSEGIYNLLQASTSQAKILTSKISVLMGYPKLKNLMFNPLWNSYIGNNTSNFSKKIFLKDMHDNANEVHINQVFDKRINKIIQSNATESMLMSTEETIVLKKHTEEFKKEISHVTDNVYVAIGYGLANVVIIRIKTGIVLIDCLENTKAMSLLLKDWNTVNNNTEPATVHGIIYSHFHADHVFGSSAVKKTSKTQIWAHEKTATAIGEVLNLLGPVTYKRAMRQFGSLLDDQDGYINAGIGERLYYAFNEEGTVTEVSYPTHIWKGEQQIIEIEGEAFELLFAPGESKDQVVVYMPRTRCLFGADNIYKAFPNIYAIRGTESRNALTWAKSLDIMRSLKPQYMVLGHTRPIIGEKKIYDILTLYRDTIQYVHDQTIRYMNKGMPIDDIVMSVKLPAYLKEHEYLQELYGTVEWSVRAIFQHYLGWFSGRAEDLHTLSSLERAQNMELLAGGYEKLLDHIISCIEKKKDLKWALELVEHLRRLRPKSVRVIKVNIILLKLLASKQTSAPGRNWLLTAARELEDSLKFEHLAGPKSVMQRAMNTFKFSGATETFQKYCENKTCADSASIQSKNINEALKITTSHKNQCIDNLESIGQLFQLMSTRVNHKKAENLNIAVLFLFEDTSEIICMHLRHSIAFISTLCERTPDVKLITQDIIWRKLIKHEISIASALVTRKIRVIGNIFSSAVLMYKFFSSFDFNVE